MILVVVNGRFQTGGRGDIWGQLDLSNDFNYTIINNLFHNNEAQGRGDYKCL